MVIRQCHAVKDWVEFNHLSRTVGALKSQTMFFFFQVIRAAPLIGAGILLWIIFLRSYKELKYRGQIYVYLIFLLFFCLAVASYGFIYQLGTWPLYTLFQCMFAFMGGLHVYFAFTRWQLLEEQRSTIISFTMIPVTIGLTALTVLNVLRMSNAFMSVFTLSSGLAFGGPIALHRLGRLADIPTRTYQWWLYPQNREVKEMSETELRDPVLIGFWIQKDVDDYFTFFRAKAPIKMDLGDLFYHFVVDYNERHPDTPITCSAGNGSSSAWCFYQKRKWWFKPRLLDPDKAVFMNRLKENDIIICRRMSE